MRLKNLLLIGMTFGMLLTGCSSKTQVTEEDNVEISDNPSVDAGDEIIEETSIVEPLEEEMGRRVYTDEKASEFISQYKNAVTAHVEYCDPSDYTMYYKSLTADELKEAKSYLRDATVDIEGNSSMADFTYTLHMFDDVGNYVYVVAVNNDKTTMFCEPGNVNADGLADFIVELCEEADSTVSPLESED